MTHVPDLGQAPTAVELVVAGQSGKVLLDVAGVLGGRTNGTTA
jgi:hypothetical protein